MNMELLLEFIRPELLILVIFLWCLGLFFKKAPWFQEEWAIPFILLFIGLIITIVYIAIVLGEGFLPEVIIMGIIQGVIIAALAVFGNELIKQGTVKRKEDKEILRE